MLRLYVKPHPDHQCVFPAQNRGSAGDASAASGQRITYQRQGENDQPDPRFFLLEFGISLPIGDAVIKRQSLVLAEHETPEYLSRLLMKLHAHYLYLVGQITEPGTE